MMTAPITTSTTDSQMHNNIIEAGSWDRPPMLATGRYAQWQSRFLRYIDTRPNGDALRKCILEGPYTPSTVTIPAVPTTEDSLEVPERTIVETILNMSPENKEHYQSEKEAIHLLLTGIRDEIYSTVDACKTLMTSSEEDSDPEQAQRDKDMQKNLALIAKYFKKIYKPTNNNLRTSSNSRNKNVDTSPRYKNDNQTRQFRNQRTVTVAGARVTVGSQVVQQTGIQCFNCKEFSHFAKECKKPKMAKDYTYHKEKMLLCKQAEKGVPLQAEQADWLADTDDEIDEQELEAHYNYMAKIQEVPTADSGTDTEPLEQVDKCDDERVALANLIANLKLDVDENKKIQKKLRKANASLTQELKEWKSNLEESNTTRDSCIIAL
ncbi:integrase, catalytic region, zinc finger, CCHC-type containing protein [Tanacetum coccineum]